MGESARFGIGDLSSHSAISARRTVRIDQSDARCSASIGANIAEGCGKRSNAEFQRFLQIASGSASELDYHLLLARDLKLLMDTDYDRVVKELSVMRRMLTALLQKVDNERFMAKC